MHKEVFSVFIHNSPQIEGSQQEKNNQTGATDK